MNIANRVLRRVNRRIRRIIIFFRSFVLALSKTKNEIIIEEYSELLSAFQRLIKNGILNKDAEKAESNISQYLEKFLLAWKRCGYPHLKFYKPITNERLRAGLDKLINYLYNEKPDAKISEYYINKNSTMLGFDLRMVKKDSSSLKAKLSALSACLF